MTLPGSAGAPPPAPTPEALGDPAGAWALGSAWWRVTLSSIGDAVITTDASGRVTFLNPVASVLTGWSATDALSKPVTEVFRIVREGDRRPAESPTLRALRDGVVVGLANHTLLLARDGRERPIETSAAPIQGEFGTVGGVVLIFRDISARRRTEEHDQEALRYADGVVATLREPFLVLDNRLRVQTANAAYYRLFKVAAPDTVGRHLGELGNGQWASETLHALLTSRVAEQRAVSDFEIVHDFPTIGRRAMQLNARQVHQPDGEPALLLLAIEDITERRNISLALQSSEVRYRRLFEAARDGILILDAATGRITDANPFMAELLGYSHEEFLDRELWEIGVFGDRTASEVAVRELQDHGYVRYDHLPLQTRGGDEVDVEFVSNVYEVDHHRVAQCNIRDMRDRRRLERQAQDQATELSDLHRRKDEFLAMLSHELRNPLAPIMNAVQLLAMQQSHENAVQQQARGIIARQVDHLKHLVDDLLEVSRITSGRVRLRLERVSVSGIVEGAVESVRPLIDERRHTLSVALPMDAIWLDADATRLEQVMTNLLTNAAKYTDEGGHIWITVHRDGEDCVFRVRDTGIGIQPELLPRIFDLFTQADRTLDRSQGGLGIGLSLVQRLTELHGGSVSATSTVGLGSEFVVRLPARRVVEAPSNDPSAAGPNVEQRHLRVLVVDDNVDMARSMSLLVSSSGHAARTAHDGATALKLALEFLPHVVLLDIGLPGFNGYEVARQLREQPGGTEVVLVAVTGYGREDDLKRALAEGFNFHMVKPPDFAWLGRLLERTAAELT